MKQDLKINFGILDEIVGKIYRYMRALEEMKEALTNIDILLADAEGQAIEALKDGKTQLEAHIDRYKEQTNDLYQLLQEYIHDMTNRVRPDNFHQMMRVDRLDIWMNIDQMENSLGYADARIPSRGYDLNTEQMDEGNNRWIKNSNNEKMEDIYDDMKRLKHDLQGHIHNIKMIFNHHVVEFEELDDYYKTKANTLYDKYTSIQERMRNWNDAALDAIGGAIVGGLTSLFEAVSGLFSLLLGGLLYLGSAIIVLCTSPFGTTPDWIQAYFDGVNTTLAGLFYDPCAIAEGIGQDISDKYDEYGIFYIAGYAVSELWLTDKLFSIFASLGKTDDLMAVLKKHNLNNVEDIWKLDPKQRGKIMEEILALLDYEDWYNIGNADNGYFPVVDFQNGLDVVSLKSIDPSAASYANGKANQKIIDYLKDLAREITIDGAPANKILDVRIPEGTEHLLNINELKRVAEELGITLKIVEV